MLVIFAMALLLSTPRPNRVDAFSRHRITPVLNSYVFANQHYPRYEWVFKISNSR
jgi:hypothetical protein